MGKAYDRAVAPASGWTQLRLPLKLAVAVAVAGLAIGLATATSTWSGTADAASANAANHCSATAIGPAIIGHSRDITRLSVASVGRFRCSGGLNGAVLKVVLQGRVRGHWRELAGVKLTRNMQAARTYTLRAKLACRSNPHQMSVRTHVELNGLRGTSPSRAVFCV